MEDGESGPHGLHVQMIVLKQDQDYVITLLQYYWEKTVLDITIRVNHALEDIADVRDNIIFSTDMNQLSLLHS